MRQDKFLVGIVIGIVGLVIGALLIALLRPAGYQPEDTPAGVAHNYLLALQRDELERVHGYLSPTLAGYPENVATLREQIASRRYLFDRGDSTSLTVEADSVRVEGNRATVRARQTIYYQVGFLYRNESHNDFTLTLEQQDEGWRLVSAERYWLECWEQASGC